LETAKLQSVAYSPQIVEVVPGSELFEAVLALSDQVLEQRRHITSSIETARADHVLAALDRDRCIGFLRFFVQVIGAEEGRPAVVVNGAALSEGFVEAFGVSPELRRRGVGSALQQRAQEMCRAAGCYQMRSRSPVSCTQNYAMKLAAGYVLQPSDQNDSYYFLLKL
jgi:GNAT superfamily N-acetyltransferase